MNTLNEYMVIKKNGEVVPFSFSALHAAVEASAACARGFRFSFEEKRAYELLFDNGTHMGDFEWDGFDKLFVQLVTDAKLRGKKICTKKIHQFVIKALAEIAPDVQQEYKEYHLSKKAFQESLLEAVESRDSAFLIGEKSNANADSSLSSTMKSLSGDAFERSLNLNLLDPNIREAHVAGRLYVQDMTGLSAFALNCCLLRVYKLMETGYTLNGVKVAPPEDLSSAFEFLLSCILICSSQQYGGLTIPRVDELLAPYADITFEKEMRRLIGMGVREEIAEAEATRYVGEIAFSGFSRIEETLNTVGSSRGDFPFITFTGGHSFGRAAVLWDVCMTVRWMRERPVLFPKLVFLYDENLHGEGKPLHWLYESGVKCSSMCMYPDWLSLTGEGYVPSIYKKYRNKTTDCIISPMGCRAFLSPWYEKGGIEPADENDLPIFEGRFNIGVVSLNLPMIYGEAKENDVDFFSYLDYHLELIRGFFRKRYKKLGELRASVNPLAFCYGGLYGGELGIDEKIAPCLKAATASFGITALNELQQFYNGKSLAEDNSFALDVMKHINDVIAKFKKEDGHLYAIYGTPAESLAGKQATQLRERFGIIPGVSDREYVTNSFHCHVTENISPVFKQDREYLFWDMLNGGKIQYVKYPVAYNVGAIETLVKRAMDMGFYEGVNLDLSFCGNCGERFELDEPDGKCPFCGSANCYTVNRMNGYLGYSRVGSADPNYDSSHNSRFNRSKMIEIRDRVSM